MIKIHKAVVLGLVAVLVVLAPACRTKKTPTPVAAPEPAPMPAPVPEPAATPVPNDDFVQPQPTVDESILSADLEQANRQAQERGFIQDAFFSYDASTLTPEGEAALTASANWLKGTEGQKYDLLIEGHCDERGTEQYNLALGDRRANTAKTYLAALGVDASRIRTVSYGEERPFDPGHDESAWAKNRRAHLVLVGK